MKYENILITGGSGFIGSNLSLKWVEKGYAITVLDNLSPQVSFEGGVTKFLRWANLQDI